MEPPFLAKSKIDRYTKASGGSRGGSWGATDPQVAIFKLLNEEMKKAIKERRLPF